MTNAAADSVKTISAPTPGRVVLFDASHLVSNAPNAVVVPAHVHTVIDRDTVTLWAVDSLGETLVEYDLGLPQASFGESRPGVPAPKCWCYPPRSDAQLEIGKAFDPEETLDPYTPPTA